MHYLKNCLILLQSWATKYKQKTDDVSFQFLWKIDFIYTMYYYKTVYLEPASFVEPG